MEVKNFLWSKFISSLLSRFLRRNPSHGSEYLSSNFSVNSFNTSRAVEIFDSMAVGNPFLDKVRRLYVIGTRSADKYVTRKEFELCCWENEFVISDAPQNTSLAWSFIKFI